MNQRPRRPTPAALLALMLLALASSSLAVENLDSHYVTLEPIVVNMQASDRGRYLQASIQLEGNSPEDAREIRRHVPALRDRLIRVLGGRSPDSLTGTEAREAIRSQATQELNAVLDEITGAPRIRALYFSDFIRQ